MLVVDARRLHRRGDADERLRAVVTGAIHKMLRRWRGQILAHHSTGANLTIKQIERSGRGFRKLDNYRLHILLTGQRDLRQTQPVTSIRARRPRLIA